MKSILKKEKIEINIKNSKFIGIIIPIECKDDVKSELNFLKNEYKNATHYCYSFKLLKDKGFSDDGEPNKTAGLPILTVIESENLLNVLLVVIRYFGGIKLGTGGLIRAYTKAAKDVINIATKIDLISGYNASITFDYSKEKTVNYILKNSIIINKKYNDNCTYIIETTKDTLDILGKIVSINYKKEKLISKIN